MGAGAPQRLSRRALLLLLAATTVAFCLSTVKYAFEAFPRHYWRGGALEASNEICPDGMGPQIELSADLLRGEPDAGPRLLHYLRATYQSSTYLISFAAAPLHLLGIPAPIAFCCVSALGSLLLLRMLYRLLVELFPDAPRWRLLVFLLMLFHPSTLRCLIRPQSDALYAMVSFGAILAGRRVAQRAAAGVPLAPTLVRLALAQLAGLFVKIHAVVLPFVTPTVAFLHGLRGRRLAAAIVVGALLPLLAWAALFQGFGLWVTIANIRAKKGEFFANWDAWRVVRIVLLTQAPLLAAALLHPIGSSGSRRFRELPLSLLLYLAGYSVLLWLTITPPNMRYVFPAQAPLVVLAAAALHERYRDGRLARAWLALALSWQLLLVALHFVSLAYLRWVGPVREIPRLAAFVFDLI